MFTSGLINAVYAVYAYGNFTRATWKPDVPRMVNVVDFVVTGAVEGIEVRGV